MWQVHKPNRGAGPASAERMEELEERRLVTVGDAGAFAKRDVHTDLKVELHQRLLDVINLSALDKMSRAQIEAAIRSRARQDNVLLISPCDWYWSRFAGQISSKADTGNSRTRAVHSKAPHKLRRPPLHLRQRLPRNMRRDRRYVGQRPQTRAVSMACQ